jgi:DNA-binding PadR family transcriptional regulator
MTLRSPRATLATRAVLQVLLSAPAEMYALEVGTAAGLPQGTVCPILARLEGLGWLESHWEDSDARTEGRPLRHYYRLTLDGTERARGMLASAMTPVPLALPYLPEVPP